MTDLLPPYLDLAMALRHRERLNDMAEAGEWIQTHMFTQCETWVREAERYVMLEATKQSLCPGPNDTIN